MRSRLLTVAVASLVGAVAALGAVAGASFVDTTNSPFATEIQNVADAGCASGFAGDTFRPRDAVTRQQFAAWMNRCGGRVEIGHGAAAVTTNTETSVATATMDAGAIEGGGGFVLVTGSLEASSEQGNAATFRLSVNGGPAVETVPLTVPLESSVGGSVTTVVPVDGGSSTVVALTAQRGSANDLQVEADLSLLYVPFAGDGSGGGVE